MLPNLYIINNSGDVLIEKHYIGTTKRYVCELFWEEVQKQDSQREVNPIITTENFYLLNVRRGGLFWLCAVNRDVSPLFVFTSIHKVIDILNEYFKDNMTEQGVRENFAMIYQLLDEVIIGGFMHTTEMNQLMDMISIPSMGNKLRDFASGSFTVKSTLPSAFNNPKMPWRKPDCKYVTNEIKIDIIESVDAIIQFGGRAGFSDTTISSAVNGVLDCNAKLSGSPDLVLSFTKINALNHLQLHRCVRISRWQKEQVISFVPPNGRFKLMKYKLKDAGQVPVHVRPMIRLSSSSSSSANASQAGTGKGSGSGAGTVMDDMAGGASGGSNSVKIVVEPNLSALQGKTIDKLKLEIPFPKETNSFALSANCGKISTDEVAKIVRWDIGKFPKEKPCMEGSVALPGDFSDKSKPTVRVSFEIKGLSMTNLKVSSLAVHGVKYKPFKGVRHITKAGAYLVRS